MTQVDPQPGDVFREYPTGFGTSPGLRVGGRLDYGGADLPFAEEIDLDKAIRAEVTIQKLQCHSGTSGLSISVNNGPWLLFPEAETIPEPRHAYQHMTYPTVPVPLESLRSGRNVYRLRVGPHGWWPQNLIFGIALRVYYDPLTKPHCTGVVRISGSDKALDRTADLSVEVSGRARQVDYLACYEDVNWEGDGRYHRWHGHFLEDRLIHHLGSALSADDHFRVFWDTRWVPDQPGPMKLAARITDQAGIVAMTPEIPGVHLLRTRPQVELCKPTNVPSEWVTRIGIKGEHFDITGDPDQAVEARLCWVGWASNYFTGLRLNGHTIENGREHGSYCYTDHCMTVPVTFFRKGSNVLETVPSVADQHGMEVNWPGIQAVIRYENN